MDNSTLGSIIPSAFGRKIAYAVYSAVAFIVGNVAIYIAATQGTTPEWLIGAIAVVNNIAPIFGAVAIANAPTTKKEKAPVVPDRVEIAPQPAPDTIAHELPPAE